MLIVDDILAVTVDPRIVKVDKFHKFQHLLSYCSAKKTFCKLKENPIYDDTIIPQSKYLHSIKEKNYIECLDINIEKI